ncbi:MAG: helix-turn-helix transcriptional regulator [Candidatus Rokubacteria bacterium]|nr:helix-turn-helix transcriptional regulator [Candidatus Rokubacteria bacterium]
MTQQQLGRRAKLSGKFIGEVERGAKSISLDSLYRVATALNVTITALTDVPGPRAQAPGRESQRLYVLLNGRRPAELRKARSVLEALFER